MKQKTSRKIALIFLLFLCAEICLPFIHIVTGQQYEGTTEITRQRVQYGYWEINPVINNILTDWSVQRSRGAVGDWGAGTVVYPTPEAVVLQNYVLDPDGTNKSDIGAEGQSSYHLYLEKSAADIGPAATRTTSIYSSAPSVGFSVGHVYLSDFEGNHWYKLGYDNFSSALDDITDFQTIVNYDTNKTYTYRTIPYSVKVCFWTMGRADFTLEQADALRLFYWTREIQDDFTQDAERVQLVNMIFDYVDQAWVDIDEVTARLKLSIEAPLWTQRATQVLQSEDGTWVADYNNTWIGFLDVKTSQIQGGPINLALDVPKRLTGIGIPINPETEGYVQLAGATNDFPPAPEDSELNGGSKIIQPDIPSTEGGFARDSNVRGEDPYNNPDDRIVPTVDEAGEDAVTPEGAVAIIDGMGWYGEREQVTEQADKIQDPDLETSYFLSSPYYARGAAIGIPQNEYTTTINQSQEYDPILGQMVDTEYPEGVSNNYISEEIRSEISEIDRQYSSDLALSKDIPNKLTFTIAATMQPSLHTWYKRITWTSRHVYQDWKIWGGYQSPELVATEGPNTMKVVNGMEVINVYITYTLTFTVVMIDRYDIQKAPATNVWASDELEPWMKQRLHEDYYDEYYDYQVSFPPPVMTLMDYITYACWGLAVILWIYWIMKARGKTKPPSRLSFMEAMGGFGGIIVKIVITIVIVLVIPLLLGWIFGSFLGRLLF